MLPVSAAACAAGVAFRRRAVWSAPAFVNGRADLACSDSQRDDCLQGLENEYDRLLAEHDALKRRLARFDPSFQGSTGKKGT